MQQYNASKDPIAYFVIGCLITILTYNQMYKEILVYVIFAGFVSIVLNSRKYKRVNDFFDSLF